MIKRLSIVLALLAGIFMFTVPYEKWPAYGAVEETVCPVWSAIDTVPDGIGWKTQTPSESTVLGESTVRLEKPDNKSGTSFETEDLGINLSQDAKLTVHYQLSLEAGFAAGAIRLFYYEDVSANTSTTGTAPDGMIDAQATSGTLELTVKAGHVGTVGVVYDASNDKLGTVTFSDMKLGNLPVAFKDVCNPPASESPSASPSPSPSHSTKPAAPVARTSTSSAAALPVTGSSVPVKGVLGFGVVLIIGGVVGVYLGRKRRAAE